MADEIPPTKPPVNIPDPTADTSTVTDSQELFPDAPTGRPILKIDPVHSSEGELVREITRADERVDQTGQRIQDRFTFLGRLTLNTDAGEVIVPTYTCNICSALVPRAGVQGHGKWHERMMIRGKA